MRGYAEVEPGTAPRCRSSGAIIWRVTAWIHDKVVAYAFIVDGTWRRSARSYSFMCGLNFRWCYGIAVVLRGCHAIKDETVAPLREESTPQTRMNRNCELSLGKTLSTFLETWSQGRHVSFGH